MSPPAYTMDLHSQATGGQRRKREAFSQTSDYHSISPSFPLICLSRAGHTDSAHILLQLWEPLSAAPSLKQTHSAHIPLLYKTSLYTVCEPVPRYTGNGLRHKACRINSNMCPCIIKNTPSIFFLNSSYSEESVCHLLPCVNSAWCHHHSHTRGGWEGEEEERGPSGEEGVDDSTGWWWVCGAGVDGWAGRQQGFKWRLTPQG